MLFTIFSKQPLERENLEDTLEFTLFWKTMTDDSKVLITRSRVQVCYMHCIDCIVF